MNSRDQQGEEPWAHELQGPEGRRAETSREEGHGLMDSRDQQGEEPEAYKLQSPAERRAMGS